MNGSRLRFALAGTVAFAIGCGGSPMDPGPVPPPPATNQAPNIESITTSAQRIEVDETVTVTASVRDAETPADQLIYEWSADGGTFAGQGASVTWRPAGDAATPANVTTAQLPDGRERTASTAPATRSVCTTRRASSASSR